MDIGRLGLWEGGTWAEFQRPEVLAELEELGIGTVWLGSSPPADLKIPERLLSTSSTLVVATGIVNVWAAEPEVAAASYHRLSDYADRLVLGIGAGHRSMVGDAYTRPYDRLVSYLDGLDAGGVPVSGRALAALGPRVLELAAARTAAAHPYLVTPEHTARAREIIGGRALLAPEQKVVLETDPGLARAAAREKLALYLTLPNYTNNWLRLGFTDDDLAGGGSDRLVDSMVVWGDEDTIRRRIEEHRAAGADQVAIQVLNRDKLGALRKLAPALA